MWHDFQEIPTLSRGEAFSTISLDGLAHISLEMSGDISEKVEAPYAKTIEAFAEQWIPHWITSINSSAQDLSSKLTTIDLYSAVTYLYFGFVSSVTRRSCSIIRDLGDIEYDHEPYYLQIKSIGDEIDQQLRQFETNISLIEDRNQVHEQQVDLSALLAHQWEDAVIQAKTNSYRN